MAERRPRCVPVRKRDTRTANTAVSIMSVYLIKLQVILHTYILFVEFCVLLKVGPFDLGPLINDQADPSTTHPPTPPQPSSGPLPFTHLGSLVNHCHYSLRRSGHAVKGAVDILLTVTVQLLCEHHVVEEFLEPF